MLIIAMTLSVTDAPVPIRLLVMHQYGQLIRQDGPTQHLTRHDTSTMDSVAIILAMVVTWLIGSFVTGAGPPWSGLLLIFLFVGLSVIGLLDGGVKIMCQHSLGLHPSDRIIGQIAVTLLFALGTLIKPNKFDEHPGTPAISFARPTAMTLGFAGLGLGIALYLIWTNLIVTAWLNATNLADGSDGLAAGTSVFVFGAYTFITYFRRIQACTQFGASQANCYSTRDPLDPAIFRAVLIGALAGSLWWNASSAQTFMGGTGTLTLGGAAVGPLILTQTQLLIIVVGDLFVVVVLSDVIQISIFKAAGERVFRMAPLHHHFELLGWEEVMIVIRFWLIAAIVAVVGAGLLYTEWASLR